MIDFGVWQGRFGPAVRPLQGNQAGDLKRSRTPAMQPAAPGPVAGVVDRRMPDARVVGTVMGI